MKTFLIVCIALTVMLACGATCTSCNKGSGGSGSNDSGSNGSGSNGSGSNGSGSNDSGSNNSGSNGSGSNGSGSNGSGSNGSGSDKEAQGGAVAAGEDVKTQTITGFDTNGNPVQISKSSADKGAVGSVGGSQVTN